MAKFCMNCGAALIENASFCSVCGAKTEEPAPAPPPDVPAQTEHTPPPYVQAQAEYTPPPDLQQAIPPASPQQYQQPPQQYEPQQFEQSQYPAQPAYPPPQQMPAYPEQPAGPQQPQYAQPAAGQKKKGGWIVPYRIIASIIVVVLIAAGIYGLVRNPGGGKDSGNDNGGERGGSSDTEVVRSSSASVKAGAIELDGATLDFGANNVTDSASMTVLKTAESQKPDGLVSELYELQLIPECAQPVTVSLPVDESQVPRDCFVMLGVGNTMDLSDGYGDTLYSYYPVEISGGVATAVFTPADSLQNMEVLFAGEAPSVPSRERVTLGLFWFSNNSTRLRSGGHFIVYFRGFRFVEADRLALLDDLESIYEEYLGKGYAYSQRKEWPMEVYIEDLSAEGYYVYRVNGYIQLNRSFFVNGYKRAGVMALMAHEFFHFTQYNYYQSFLSDNLWCDEATATYFELKHGGNPELPSAYFPLNFSGVFPENNTKYEGYARGPLIAYLAGRYGEDFILKAYQEASASVFPDLKSCIRNATADEGEWAADYYEALVTNKVDAYSVLPATLRLNIAGGADYANAGKTLDLIIPGEEALAAAEQEGKPVIIGETTLSLGNYNAQFVVLDLSDTEKFLLEVSELDDPVVTIGGENADAVELRVISYRGSGVSVLKGTEGKATLSDFKENVTGGTRYIIMAVGPAGAKGSYDIKVEVTSADPTLDELVGIYADCVVTYKDFYISDEFISAFAGAMSDMMDGMMMGCEGVTSTGAFDANELGIIGQEIPIPFEIIKTGVNTGILQPAIPEDELDDDDDGTLGMMMDMYNYKFTYSGGVLSFEDVQTISEEGATMTMKQSGSITASYGADNKSVVLAGDVTNLMSGVSIPDEGYQFSGDFMRMSMGFAGTKPLPAKDAR